MEAMSRRMFCGAAFVMTAAPALAAPRKKKSAEELWVKCPDGSVVRSSTSCLTNPTSPTTPTSPTSAEYQSTLGADGLTPEYPTWNGRKWSAALKSTDAPGLDYCWRVTENRSRFELKADETRAELHESRTKLPNGVSMWGAFTYLDRAWPNAAGMLAETGGCFTQMHWPGSGSPAFAFRRGRDGKLVITTRGDGQDNTKRYEGAMSFGLPHDIVYRFVLGPQGELDVWVDGAQIVNFRGPVGSATPGCYWCIGCYYAGGTGGNTVIQEYGNHVFPTTASLESRVANLARWPTN